MARPQGRVENRPVDHASGTSARELATGLELIEQAERRLGSRRNQGSPARAVGRTMAGGGGTVVHCGPAAPEAAIPDDLPLVQHTLFADDAHSTAPVLLVAGSHQEAVDHCMIAHLAAERMACRVESGVAGSVARRLGMAELPDASTLTRARASLPKCLSSSESDPVAILEGCVAAAADGLGRTLAPTVSSSPDGCPIVIVTLGAFADLAEEIAARSKGKIGHLAMRLLRPFPLSRMRQLLSTAETVLLVAPRDSALHFEACCRIGTAIPEKAGLRMVRLTDEADPAEFLQALSVSHPSDIWADLQENVAAPTGPNLRVALVPSGAEAAELLRRTGTLLVASSSGTPAAKLERRDAALASIVVGSPAEADGAIDLLVVLDDRFAPAHDAIRLVKEKGTVVIPSCGGSSEVAWTRLSRSARLAILERQLKLLIVDLDLPAKESRAAWARAIADLAEGGSTGSATELDLSMMAELESSSSSDTPAVRFLPVGGTEHSVSPEMLEEVRKFHLTGRLSPRHQPFMDVPLETLAASAAAAPFHRSFPVVFADDGEPEPLFSVVRRVIQEGRSIPVVSELLPDLAQWADLSAGSSVDGKGLSEALEQALTDLSSSVELSDAGKRAFFEEADALRAALAGNRRLVGFREDSWLHFYRWASRKERRPRIRQFEKEAVALINRLEALLRADETLHPQSQSAASMASTLGMTGAGRIDLDRLAGTVSARRGSRTLEPERLGRIENVLATLRNFVRETSQTPELYVVSSSEVPWKTSEIRLVRSDSPFETALGLVEGLAERTLEIVRALRTARLEADGEYVPELHDEAARGLNWDSLESDELLLSPSVLVLESGRRLSERTLAEFHRLIESGRPVHICISTNESLLGGDEPARNLAGVLPDPGYLGLAEREAFVLQSTLARPDHLMTGLQRMCRIPGPAVCVLSFPDQEGRAQWLWNRCQTAWLSRALPLFVYDPWAGDSWADRFSLEGNPEAEQALVKVEVADLGTQDASITVDEALTFAHVLAQDPRFREQFWVIPSTAWSEDQKLVEDFLGDFAQPALGVVPFIWVVDAQGRLQRAVVTREVVSACRDRLRSWRTLQELAGVRSAYVDRAVERVRKEISEASLGELEKARREARRAGAEEAIGKLVEVLSDVDSLSRERPSRRASSRDEEVAEKRETPTEKVGKREPEKVEPPAEPGATEDDFADEAYIDSFLCTSCNECINLNPRMFSYNADRQAFISDDSAGTFAELVKAAEACPARCIHPGSPRFGDTTATPNVVERSKAFR